MKKLTNKKGFTLIEMLVVIAIIAVLVAIIIPVVSSATTKAAAATDAANMRSLKAEIVTAYLSDGAGDGKAISLGTAADGKQSVTLNTSKIKYPAMKEFKVGDTTIAKSDGGTTSTNWTIEFTTATSEFTVKYGGKTIAEIANVAETGSFPAPTGG